MGKSRPIWGSLVVAVVLAIAALAPAGAAAAGPTATTGGVTHLTSTSAVLNGSASPGLPPSSYHFEYGTTTTYGKSTPKTGLTAPANVSAAISGLLPGTTYHYRLVAESDYQPTPSSAPGHDVTFTTPTESPATTGQASSIGTTSAELNGVANTVGPNSSWFFEYGRTTGYGQTTAMHPIGSGLTLLATKVAGLTPDATYHFRLVVLQSAVPPSYGSDASFTTATPNGHATLVSRRLRVRHGLVAIPFACKGFPGGPCKAKLTLKARGKIRKHVATVSCGNAKLATSAVHRRTVHVKLGRCGPLLRKAPHGRLRGTLRAVFSTNQRTIQTAVTLLRP